MREIKFKVWDKKEKHWVGEDVGSVMDLNYSLKCNAFVFDNDNFDMPQDFVVCQFTGLKDKNGKEIYEGDIFTFTEGGKKKIGQVVFEDAMFKMKDKNGWGAMALQIQSDEDVVGNIYENPELLSNVKRIKD